MRRISRMVVVGLLAGIPMVGGLGGAIAGSGIARADIGSGGGDTCLAPNLTYESLNPGHTVLTLQYSENGNNPIAKIVVVKLTNATESDNAPGATVTVTITKINGSKSATFDIKAVSKKGCFTETDPIMARVGANHMVSFHHLGSAEHRILVSGARGISVIRITVNRTQYVLRHLVGSRLLNVSRAMHGAANTIRVQAEGRAGTSASVVISN